MIPFLQAITSKLLEIHPRVYQEQAPKEDPYTQQPPSYPYIVYHVDPSTMVEQREDIIFTVDVWDNKSGNTLPIETLANDVFQALKGKHVYNENVQISIYPISRLPIPDPDPLIRRRQLRFRAQTYFLEG